jgi:hypothetical protein
MCIGFCELFHLVMRLLRNELTSDRVLKSLLQERCGPSVSQPILTLNRSAYQVNLQDPAVNMFSEFVQLCNTIIPLPITAVQHHTGNSICSSSYGGLTIIFSS